MLASQLQDLLVNALIREAGGSPRRRGVAPGPVQLRDPRHYAPCNWEICPSGSARENAAIEQLLDTVRLEHPTVTRG